MGRFIITCYSLLKAVYCASPHSKLCPVLSSLVKAEVIDANPGMNLRIYETFPKKLFNSFIMIGDSFLGWHQSLLLSPSCSRKGKVLSGEKRNRRPLRGYSR